MAVAQLRLAAARPVFGKHQAALQQLRQCGRRRSEDPGLDPLTGRQASKALDLGDVQHHLSGKMWRMRDPLLASDRAATASQERTQVELRVFPRFDVYGAAADPHPVSPLKASPASMTMSGRTSRAAQR